MDAPGTDVELDQIEKEFCQMPFTRLEGDRATSAAVLDAINKHSWVHLACHSFQHTSGPSASAFYLHDGQLDLATIAQKVPKHASLAFLSACQTAMGDGKPPEALHLAAGMIMAGYPSVITKIWSIADEDASLVAEKVYAHLLEGGVADSRKAPQGLHIALGCLRNKFGERAFARWVPYVHVVS
jgi:CHAT domain-containing protein